MKLYLNQLNADLKKTLRPIYLLAGDEPLQLMEAGDLIVTSAKNAGYCEKEVHHVERNFDWGLLYQAANCLSLFSEKKIIDLRFTSSKPGDKGSEALLEYCQSVSNENILLLRMPKVEKATQNSKWYKQIETVGAVVQIWPVEIEKLPEWIAQRAQSRGLSFSAEAGKLLAEKVEGNMLAAAQEIEKLTLNEKRRIEVSDLLDTISDAARYDVFKLTDAIMMGKPKRTARILSGLQASGEEPLFVLWALTNELRTMIKVIAKQTAGKNLSTIFTEERVWDKRQELLKSALQRLRSAELTTLLQQAILIDKMIKGFVVGNVWDKLMDLSLQMSGKTLVKVNDE